MTMRGVWILLPALAGCSFLEGELRDEPPPLLDMEEPLALHGETEDEAERVALPAGSFSGVYVGDERRSLEEMEDEPEGLLVLRVVENSPGDAAGLREGDLLLEVEGASGARALRWPSEWRDVELRTEPGSKLRLLYDRAGVELRTELTVVARVRPALREPAERFREEARVGIVVRTATEVESRNAGLGPGAGAVVVGLARTSPWRKAGLRFGDLIVDVDGKPVAHPGVLLDVIRATPKGESVALTYVRDGKRSTLQAPISRRASEITKFKIPLIINIERDGGFKTVSVLLGIYKSKKTPAAWETRLLWLIKLRGGDADHLEEVEEPAR